MMKKSRSNSLLTSKCELLVQMIKQSYPSLFTLIIGLTPISIKILLCNFDVNLSSEKLPQALKAGFYYQSMFLIKVSN